MRLTSKSLENKNNLRTFPPEKRGIFKSSQIQINFTGSYKKECTHFVSMWNFTPTKFQAMLATLRHCFLLIVSNKNVLVMTTE